MAHGQMNHLEIPADDAARARKFYEGLFGWETSEMPEYPNYFLFNGALFLIATGYEKMLARFESLAFLRGWIFTVLRKRP